MAQVPETTQSQEEETLLYFNPSCTNCQTARGLLEERGVPTGIVEYLDDAPSRQDLESILGKLGTDDPAEIIRTHEPIYAELGLASADRDGLLDAMAAHPILIQRPIVIRGERAVVARPPEKLLDLLD